VEAITGKPYKPTTQGKNERFHQTLFRCLDKQPLADMLAGVHYKVDGRYGFQDVVVITDGDKITVADLHGEILIEHTRAAPA
jgi:hypothetical protein